jgi:preprotein translocase subunit SecG
VQNFLFVAQIVLSIALVLAVLLQVKGGGLGGIFGRADTVYRTRRGMERMLFQLTVVLAVLFIIVSMVVLKIS